MAKADSLLTTTVVVLLLCVGVQGDPPEINSHFYGRIRGQVRTSEDGRRANEFLGIPYALPPVGDRRFLKSVGVKKFQKPYEAVYMPPACPQYLEQPFPWYDSEPGQSEDCLYLNVWAPAVVGEQKRPVKMYVHGGGWFESGSNRMGYYDGFGEALDTLDGDGNSTQDGIVVVTVNYRLGALGFFTSGTDDAPGNAGLFDLSLAHYWLLDNVQYFGGDNKKVTVVGQGHGAIAASLFATAINQFPGSPKYVLNGATFLTLKAFEGVDERGDAYDNNLRVADALAEAVGCHTSVKDNPKDTVGCLRGVNATQLVVAMAALVRKGPPNAFLPQFKGEDGFFIVDPYQVLHEHPARHSVFASFTTDEGSHLLTAAFPKIFGNFGEKDVPLSAACAKKLARRFLKKFPQSVVDQLLGDLDPKPTTANRQKVVQAIGDAHINCPFVFFAEETRHGESVETPIKVYMLVKKVLPPYNPWSPWMGSVGFDSVQIDFLHPDRRLTVNGKTYEYTDEQSEQARVNHQLHTAFRNSQDLPFDEFTTDDPAYGYLGTDGKVSNGKNFQGQNCNILRPYFEYKKT